MDKTEGQTEHFTVRRSAVLPQCFVVCDEAGEMVARKRRKRVSKYPKPEKPAVFRTLDEAMEFAEGEERHLQKQLKEALKRQREERKRDPQES